MGLSDLLPYLTQKYYEWVSEQRDFHLAHARPLSNEERSLLQHYFDERILGLTRIATTERISNPAFYSEFTELDTVPPMDFTQASAITLVDCVLICRRFEHNPSLWTSILFHEMVHVVQCDILGLRKLLELYITEWLQNQCQYHSVLFENQAYSLECRFDRHEPFSVKQIVEQELIELAR